MAISRIKPRSTYGQGVSARIASLVAILLVISGVVITGLVWRQFVELERNEHIYEYHLASARLAEAVERDIVLIFTDAAWRNNTRETNAAALNGFDDGVTEGALYSIQKNLDLIVKTEKKYGEESVDAVLESLVDADRLFRAVISAENGRLEEHTTPIGEITAAYRLRAGQLARIHRRRLSELTTEAVNQRRRTDTVLLTIFLAVIFGGGWITIGLFSRIARNDTQIRESQSLLRAVADNVPGGVFRCAVHSIDEIEILYQSEGLADVFGGRLPGRILDLNIVFDSLHPQDQEMLLQKTRRSIQTREGFDCDFRVDLGGQGYRWCRVMASADETGSEKQLWTGLVLDVTEKKEAEAVMIRARLLAEDANKSKSRFLASMSHEIRTPMNAVLGFAQIMESSPIDKLSDRQKECIRQIMTGGRHLLSLIDDVLDLSRIESGRADIDFARVESARLVEECFTLVETLADARNIQLIKPTNLADVPDVLADQTRLRQVLLNLLSNAIKYNRTGGRVMLGVSAISGGMVRFEVKDTGEGISPEMVDELFKPFSRLGREALNIEGTGIGLVISKMLMEQMDGYIGYETEPGKGSTFWLDIPVADECVSALESIEANEVNVASGTSGQNTILYIEDNPSNVELIRRLLLDHFDVSFISAPDGEIGLTLAKQTHPDLVLLDLNLPGIDGYQVLKKLQEMDETRDSPIIALTALAMDEDIKRGVEAGFTNYITKPFDIRDVQEKIQAALDGQKVANG